MKSTLSKFKKLADRPTDEILGRLRVDEETLLELMKQWIVQGYFSKDDPHYDELRKRHRQRQEEVIYRERLKLLHRFQELVDVGIDPKMIAEQLEIISLKGFYHKWVKTLTEQGMDKKTIAQELRITPQRVGQIQSAYQQKQREKQTQRKRQIAANHKRAKKMLADIAADYNGQTKKYYIYDIEATQCPDEAIEIAIIDLDGEIILNQLIRPQFKISRFVQRLTGITNEMVSDQPDIHAVMPRLKAVTDGKCLLSWGSDYDKVVLRQIERDTGMKFDCRCECAQHLHMGLLGELDQISLNKAADCPSQDHRALEDCYLVLKVLHEDFKVYAPKD